MIPPLFGKQEVGIWCVQKRFPRYGVPIWSLWPNIRFLPSIVAEKNVHICSMCIKTNIVGIWRVQKCYPQYGIPIWCLWPNIRFLPLTVTEKNAKKNILDRQTREVKQYTPLPLWESGGIITKIYNIFIHSAYKSVKLEAQWAEPVLLTFHSALRKLNQCSS